jgi:hypothetical protein
MNKAAILAAVLATAVSVPAAAQEHWTEGPVWNITYYRTKPGKFDDYLKYIRGNYHVMMAENKRQGLVLDYKTFINPEPRDDKDWNIAFATLFPSYAKALDYSAEDDAKGRAIAEKHYKTADQEKQRVVTEPRFGWRDYVTTRYIREVNLKPMP